MATPLLSSPAPQPGRVSTPPPPFLEMDAPPWAARGLAYLLLLLFAMAVLMAALLHIPNTVSSSFVVLPVRGTDPLKAPRSGIVAAVQAAEGKTVGQSETLVVIRSAAMGERAAELQTLTTQLHGIEESLVNTRQKYQSQQRAAEEESRRLQERLAYLSRAIASKQREMAFVQDAEATYQRLHERGLASRLEYTNRQLGTVKALGELDQVTTERQETRNALARLRHEAAASQAEYQELTRRLKEDQEKTRIWATALRQELAQSRGGELAVLASCAGTVLRLRIQAPGAVVQEGEILGELACAGERLQAELTVPQSGVGRITPGMGVKLLYDAFPYQHYGVRHGTVRWVSPSSVMVKDTPVFRVFADLEVETMMVEGQPRPLLAGMSGRAEVVVGRTAALHYAFAPLRQLQAAFADTPAFRGTPSITRKAPDHEQTRENR